jgi:hypothetical protein
MVAQGPAVPKTDATWVEEKECLILLLKARMMLRDIVEGRLRQGIYDYFCFVFILFLFLFSLMLPFRTLRYG